MLKIQAKTQYLFLVFALLGLSQALSESVSDSSSAPTAIVADGIHERHNLLRSRNVHFSDKSLLTGKPRKETLSNEAKSKTLDGFSIHQRSGHGQGQSEQSSSGSGSSGSRDGRSDNSRGQSESSSSDSGFSGSRDETTTIAPGSASWPICKILSSSHPPSGNPHRNSAMATSNAFEPEEIAMAGFKGFQIFYTYEPDFVVAQLEYIKCRNLPGIGGIARVNVEGIKPRDLEIPNSRTASLKIIWDALDRQWRRGLERRLDASSPTIAGHLFIDGLREMSLLHALQIVEHFTNPWFADPHHLTYRWQQASLRYLRSNRFPQNLHTSQYCWIFTTQGEHQSAIFVPSNGEAPFHDVPPFLIPSVVHKSRRI